MNTPPIFLGSILLEPNRWKPGRPPSVRISEWSARAAAAGFDGWELWENHYRLVDSHEQAALRGGELPVRVFNAYADFGALDPATAADAFAPLRELPSVTAVKFNVGNNPHLAAHYRTAIEVVRNVLPSGVRLWCECHPGTMLEDPARLDDFVGSDGVWPFDIIIHPFLLKPEEIVRWGKIAGPHIRHAHVQMRDLNDERHFVALADDAGRAGECLAALEAIDFSGSYTVEFARHTRTGDDVAAVLFEDAIRDLRFLRARLTRSAGASIGNDARLR